MKDIMQKILIALFLFFFSPNISIAAELLSEDFTLCEIPYGWTLENFGDSCNEWIFSSDRSNETGGEGCYAVANSDDCGSGTSMDTALVTPPIDCSASSGTTLSFMYDALEQLNQSIFAVQVSVNSGVDWVDKWQRTQSDQGPRTATVDISAEADRQPSVLIRFRYTAQFDWWWQVDDVIVSSSENKFNWLLFFPAIMGGRQSP